MVANARTIGPSIEPVTADELDAHLRGDGVLSADDGTLLETLISAAREYVETFTRRALITQTWTLVLDNWPKSQGKDEWWDGVRDGSITEFNATASVELPIGPLQSVTSITTYDQNNVPSVFDPTQYYLNKISTPGEINLNSGSTWPVFTRNKMGIEIVYVAGYGDNASDVPAPLRLAIKMLAAHWYENREYVKTQSDQNQAPSPLHVQSILNRYRVMKL